MRNKILEVKDLQTYFYTYAGVVKALAGVNLEIEEQGSIGLVGETGCGKSVTALSITRLITSPGKIIGGEVFFKGEDLLKYSETDIRQKIRGKEISMIFQEPIPALNPVVRVGRQISEVFQYREKLERKQAEAKAIEALKQVRISDPKRVVDNYPHELSGGMAQRVMIAMALAAQPSLLIADEPTTNLDVTIEAQILELIRELREETKASLMMITHNLAILSEEIENVAVMYAGRVAEYGKVRTIFEDPQHPYTKGLVGSIPDPTKKEKKLSIIPGSVPNLITPPTGCRFHPRCKYAMEICSQDVPHMKEIENERQVACFLFDGGIDNGESDKN